MKIWVTTVLLVVFSLSCTQKKEPSQITEEEYSQINLEGLKSGKGSDKLILGLKFGMTQIELENTLQFNCDKIICDDGVYNVTTYFAQKKDISIQLTPYFDTNGLNSLIRIWGGLLYV
jgi:hypothetical protein